MHIAVDWVQPGKAHKTSVKAYARHSPRVALWQVLYGERQRKQSCSEWSKCSPNHTRDFKIHYQSGYNLKLKQRNAYAAIGSSSITLWSNFCYWRLVGRISAVNHWDLRYSSRPLEQSVSWRPIWTSVRVKQSMTPRIIHCFYYRSYHGTAVIDRKLYCIGGFNGTDYFNTCSCFNAEKKTWKEIAPMHIRRCYVSVASLNGFIYALGGYDGHSRQNTGERYDPKKNQWTMIAPMHLQRSDADACTLNGKIFITGGFNGQECLNTAEFYTPETNTWTMLPPMLSRRSGVSCVAHQGFIYVIGNRILFRQEHELY